MKEIQLTQGKVALVDDADFEWLSQWKWYAHKNRKGKSWYAVRTVYKNGRHYAIKMHRLILGLTDPKILCDHKDLDGLNNQRSNIRKCSRSENGRNKCSFGRTSLFKGVSFKSKGSKWVAQINYDGRQRHLGYFKTEDEAARAYNEASAKKHGYFARLNETT